MFRQVSIRIYINLEVIHTYVNQCTSDQADNINGFTIHSFFALPWTTNDGQVVNTSDKDDWMTFVTKMSLLKFVVIDEVEAAGLGMLNQIHSKLVQSSTRPAAVFRKVNADEKELTRMFGGVTLIMSGDFWQLNPTGDTAIMSNPESAHLGIAKLASSMFWDCQTTDWGLQKWPGSNAYVHELSQNIRSGDDKWWNEVLEQARQGTLSEDNYNWLHGFPATPIRHAQLKFWCGHKVDVATHCKCPFNTK